MDPNLPRPYPWERQPGESPASFEAFQRYLAMGSARNIAELGRQEGRDLGGLAHEHRWTARADAWARHADEIRNIAAEDELAEMGRRHVRNLLQQGDILAKHIQRMLEDPKGGRPLTLRECVQATETLIKLERLVRGESTDRVSQEAPPELLDLLTEEQLAEYIARRRRR